MSEKLAIIVPYRDREEHLSKFVNHMDKFLSERKISYKIFIVEQGDDKPFNRGRLLNIGYTLANKDRYDYFCFHDIDMLPEDDSCDYSWVTKPTHLASKLSKFKYNLVYPEYFGGVTLFNKEHFEWINGFSNNYWGWGFEDDDLLYRCRTRGVPLEETFISDILKSTPKVISCMEFDGKEYIEIKNTHSLSRTLNKSFSVETWAEPSKRLTLNPTKDYDEFHIFTRPGHHTGICYTSGLQFKSSIWSDIATDTPDDSDNFNQNMVVSDRVSSGWHHIIFTVDSLLKRIRMYVNGVEVGNSPTDYSGNLKLSSDVSYFIGCANPRAKWKDEGYFKGKIAQITLWNKSLHPSEIPVLYNEGYPYPVTYDKSFDGWKAGMEKYKSSKNVVGFWNFSDIVDNTVLDKSGNDNHGIINGAIRREHELKVGKEELIPFRRNGKYTCLEHNENGWGQVKFVHTESRKNQLRFFNEVRTGLIDFREDGLNSLNFKILDRESFLDKHEFIKVV